jgi:hypothetical protein
LEACTTKYAKLRIDKLSNVIQQDMQRLAKEVLNEQKDLPKDGTSLMLDDVAIHFRCGDVLGGQLRNDSGMIPFREYTKWIWASNTTSIGIVTQPFQKDRNRKIDGQRAEACRIVVEKLVEYLQGFYPKARISIRNDPDTEPLPVAYARLILAKQAFTSLSSFGIFPLIASHGHGYFQQGNAGVNPWANFVPDYLPNVHAMHAPVMGTHDIYKVITQAQGLEPLLEWFVAEEEADE